MINHVFGRVGDDALPGGFLLLLFSLYHKSVTTQAVAEASSSISKTLIALDTWSITVGNYWALLSTVINHVFNAISTSEIGDEASAFRNMAPRPARTRLYIRLTPESVLRPR